MMLMKPAKAREILELNVKEAGKTMPPDVKEALEVGIKCITVVIGIQAYGWTPAEIKKHLPNAG